MTQTNIYTDTFLDSGIVKFGILQNIIHYLALKKLRKIKHKKCNIYCKHYIGKYKKVLNWKLFNRLSQFGCTNITNCTITITSQSPSSSSSSSSSFVNTPIGNNCNLVSFSLSVSNSSLVASIDSLCVNGLKRTLFAYFVKAPE